MKKLMALLLALVMCLGTCAMAEEEDWKDYDPIIMGLMFENTDEVMEETVSRVVAMACAVLDYALTEPAAYTIGGGDTYYIMLDEDILLFCCPLMENDAQMQSAVIMFSFGTNQYSVLPTVLPVAELADALSETAETVYSMTNTNVADAAELLLDAITSE